MQRRATPEDAGARLDAFLAAPLGSRARAQRLIEAGRVLVDGRAAPKRHLLSAGELVTVDEPEEAPAPATCRRAVRACPTSDEHLLVVDKPAGVVVHPARGHRTGTLAQALSAVAAGGEDAARAGIVHRLDRDTSGLLVVARSEAVHRALRNALQARDDHARVPRPGRGPPAGAQRDDRRAAGARPPRAHADVDRHRRSARAGDALRDRARRCRAPRCCACAWRPGARTRSAPTCRRSSHPVVGDPGVRHAGRVSGSSASSCTRRGWPSRTRSPGRRSTSARRCPTTSAAALGRGHAPSDPQLGAIRDRRPRRRRAARASRRARSGTARALLGRAASRRTTSRPSARRCPRGRCACDETARAVRDGSKAGWPSRPSGAPRAREDGWSPLGSAAWTAPRSSHQSGAPSLPSQRGYVTHTTTPPPGLTTRASSSAARGAVEPVQGVAADGAVDARVGERQRLGVARRAPAPAPMCAGEDGAHGVERLDGDDVEALRAAARPAAARCRRRRRARAGRRRPRRRSRRSRGRHSGGGRARRRRRRRRSCGPVRASAQPR